MTTQTQVRSTKEALSVEDTLKLAAIYEQAEKIYKSKKVIPWTEAIAEALAEQTAQQEPVAWMVTSEMQDGTKNTYPLTGRFKDVKDVCDFGNPVPLYTTPPPVTESHKRKPLTDEQIVAIYGNDMMNYRDGDYMRFARAIESAHGIKGGA